MVVESDCKIAEALTLVVFIYAPPAVVSIALKSAAAVKVGFINRPLVIPFAPPVWLIVNVDSKADQRPAPVVGLKLPK